MCKGWLTNNGSHTARDVHVYFWYRTAQGDTALAVGPSSGSIEPYAHVPIFVPPQITDGELRFPALGNITWAGGSSFVPGDPAPAPNNLGYSCLLSPDSARVDIGCLIGAARGKIAFQDIGGEVVVAGNSLQRGRRHVRRG